MTRSFLEISQGKIPPEFNRIVQEVFIILWIPTNHVKLRIRCRDGKFFGCQVANLFFFLFGPSWGWSVQRREMSGGVFIGFRGQDS